ncbi:uncharacterized protein LOC116051614 isoform X3 [Sander lucioperca]|uniref:uncharacterized protein LOC116051614 isoform X3 n=1 Tax=Sander lucioperca TaxID=283035 RepID=UPI001653E137|nr:uncharacterized protein LOC116051614 isoform X3 [Sander lucioperca]
MENEAEHVKNRETDSTSRPSSRESEKTVSSVIDEIASIIVSDKLDRTSCNINELMQSISWWEAEERSKSETNDNEDKSSADCRINQKVKRHLKRFFGLRQIFAEHKGEPLKDTKEDLVIEMDSTQAPSGQDGHHVPTNVSTQKFCNSDWTVEKSAGTHGRNVIKRMKSTLKRHFKLKKKAAEQNLDGSPCPEDLRSNHLEGEHEDVTVEETINISSTLSLTGSSQPEEHYEVTSEVMEENLVTDIVLTPGRSEAEQKDEIAGSASSNLTSKNTNLREAPIYMEMDAPSCPEEAYPTASICSNEDIKAAEEADLNSDPVELVDVKHEDITPEAKKVPLTLSPTGSSRPVEHHEVRSAVIEDDLVTNLDSLPGPSGQDGHLEPSQVNLAAEHNVDEIIMTASSHLMSSCASPKEMSPTASKRSSEDNKAAEESGLTSVPLKLVDVADKDATPGPFLVLPGAEHADEEVRSASSESRSKDTNLTKPGSPFSDKKGPFMEMDAPSQENNKDVRVTSLTVSTQTSCDTVRTDEKSAGGRESKIFKKIKSAWNTFFRLKPSEKVQLTTGQDLDDAVELQSCDSKSGSPSPEEMSPTASIHSCEDNKAAEESDLTSVPLELVDVADKNVTPQEKEDVASKPSTLSSLPPVEHRRESFSVTEKELVKYRDSTPGPSEQDRHPEGFQEDNGAAALPQLIGLKNVFYTIIKGFFDSLTDEERREISRGVYNTDVKDKLAHNCAEVLRLVIETITDILSQAMNQFAHPHATLTRGSPTSFQACGAVGQNFVLTEDNLQQSLKNTFGEAYCEVIGTDTSVSITPKFTEAIMRAITDEVNSILSETIQASLSGGSSHVRSDTCCKFSSCRACKKMLVIRAIKSLLTQFETQKQSDCESKDDRLTDEHTAKVHEKKSPWWSCFRKLLKKKVHPVSDEQMDEAVRLSPNKLSSGHRLSSSPQATSSTCSKCSSKLNSTPLEVVDYVTEDEDFTAEDTGNTPPSDLIGWFPTACLEETVMTPKHSDCESKDDKLTDEHTIKVHENKSPWWSCFRKLLKKKVHTVSDEQMDEAVRLSPNKLSSGHRLSSSPQATSSICSKHSSEQNSTPLEVVDYVTEDEDFTEEDTGNTPPSHSIGWFPTACLEDEVIVSENQESPPLSTTQTEVRSSSCHQFSDSGDVKSDVGTEQGVTAASDTEANETQAEKSNRICPYCKRKMDNDERASAQDQAVHTKRSSLLKRIWLFCCRQNCDSYE